MKRITAILIDESDLKPATILPKLESLRHQRTAELADIVLFVDGMGNTKILKNRYGKNGDVGNSNFKFEDDIESQFKVGNICKILLTKDGDCEFDAGDLVVIKEVLSKHEYTCYHLNDLEFKGYCTDEDMELMYEDESELPSILTFKIGERLKLVSNTTNNKFNIGEELIVTDIDADEDLCLLCHSTIDKRIIDWVIEADVERVGEKEEPIVGGVYYICNDEYLGTNNLLGKQVMITKESEYTPGSYVCVTDRNYMLLINKYSLSKTNPIKS